MQEKKSYDVIIIGAGVAGMTAAIYLKRADKSCVLIENNIPGGQIINTMEISNYPGFENISGPQLATNILNQVKSLEIEILNDSVKDIKIDGEIKRIFLKDVELFAKNIIIATGKIPKKLGFVNEDKFIGRGISYCATCDGMLYSGKKVAVIGGGDKALEEALYLSNVCDTVYLLHRRDSYRAKKYLQDDVNYKENIIELKPATINKIIEQNDMMVGLEVLLKEEQKSMAIDGCFVAIGYIPNTSWLTNLNICDDNGYIITNNNMETSIKGIYAIGDVRAKDVCQIITAASDAVVAVSSINKR